MSSFIIFKIAPHVSAKDSSGWTLSSPEISADAAQSDEIHTVDLGETQVSNHLTLYEDSPNVCVLQLRFSVATYEKPTVIESASQSKALPQGSDGPLPPLDTNSSPILRQISVGGTT